MTEPVAVDCGVGGGGCGGGGGGGSGGIGCCCGGCRFGVGGAVVDVWCRWVDGGDGVGGGVGVGCGVQLLALISVPLGAFLL